VDHRKLHPREEPYRWAIEKLDDVFGRERVRVTPRQHHHIIRVAVTGEAGQRAEELTLRSPTEDINRQADPSALLNRWAAEVRKRLGKSSARGSAGKG
jgi:hypothetical protein